jgi:hypothetical protein
MSTNRSPPATATVWPHELERQQSRDLPDVPSAAPDRVRSDRIESGQQVTLTCPPHRQVTYVT